MCVNGRKWMEELKEARDGIIVVPGMDR
jgi:hypothetical protein